MDKSQPTHRPQLFVLRVWLHELGDGNQEWRGEIEYAVSREKRYFREWSVLLDFVQSSCEQALRQAAKQDDFPMSNNQNP